MFYNYSNTTFMNSWMTKSNLLHAEVISCPVRRVVEWFSALPTEQKVRASNPDREIRSVYPAEYGYLIQFREGLKGSGRRTMNSVFHMLCPKQVTAATAFQAMGPLNFFLFHVYSKMVFIIKQIALYKCWLCFVARSRWWLCTGGNSVEVEVYRPCSRPRGHNPALQLHGI